MNTDTDYAGTSLLEAIPRIALFIQDSAVHIQLEEILRRHYSSLLIVNEKQKIKEFDVPLIIVADSIKEVSEVRALEPTEGTKILLISSDGDSEIIGAAFEAGADDYLAYPFSGDEVVKKTEKYLEAFRQSA